MTYVAVVISHITVRRRTNSAFFTFIFSRSIPRIFTLNILDLHILVAWSPSATVELEILFANEDVRQKIKGDYVYRKIYSENMYFLMCISDLVIVLIHTVSWKEKRKKKDCLAIFHSSPNLDIASRNQIRKYATRATVTGNIQLHLCLRTYWPPLEFLWMPRIRPRLLLFAHTSPQSLERLHDVASHACITTKNILCRVSACRPKIISSHCHALSIFCRPINNRTTFNGDEKFVASAIKSLSTFRDERTYDKNSENH